MLFRRKLATARFYILFEMGVPLSGVIIFREYPAMRKLLGISDLNKMRFHDRTGR